jgi:hypothetical protein
MGSLVQRGDFGGWAQLALDRPDTLNFSGKCG